ncbi:hypothetical protein EST38_g3344 [Candolleomyces aberdarensis]|uniref:Uncharacterized protein n=1 Tax=Candolleomyces aberdarensis TaxID=2316362 RepID=A0A4Q2DQ59_9AGAR|nr:hypothetical protein EST38_g3344 [Candolleomyces aberdarensis]
MLDRVSKAGFFNSQFIEVNNSLTTSSSPDFATTRLLESIRKDSRLNGYNPEDPATIQVPRFTFDIISCLPFAAQKQFCSSNSPSPSNYGSCAFDLARSLDMLPSQEYGLLLVMVEVEVDKVGRYNDRYCGYLSRHGLVLLASRYARRVSMASGPSGGIVIDTSLGRFKVFEHDHRTYVHFDSGMRTAAPAVNVGKQYTQSVPDVDVVRRAAEGRHLARNLYVMPEVINTTPKDWKEPGSVPTIKTAILNVLQDLECSVFLPSKLAKEWELVAQFSSDLLQSVAQIFFDIQEPKRLVQLRDIFSEGMKRKDKSFGDLSSPDEDIEQGVVKWGYVVKVTSGAPERLRVISDMNSDEVHDLVLNTFGTLCKGHSKFRAATLDYGKLGETSDKRFLSIFEAYKAHPSTDRLEEELRRLLHKSENICLVLWQAVLATLAYWNACKALRFGIESPDEWIQFILAQDSDILIG